MVRRQVSKASGVGRRALGIADSQHEGAFSQRLVVGPGAGAEYDTGEAETTKHRPTSPIGQKTTHQRGTPEANKPHKKFNPIAYQIAQDPTSNSPSASSYQLEERKKGKGERIVQASQHGAYYWVS